MELPEHTTKLTNYILYVVVYANAYIYLSLLRVVDMN